MVRSGMFLLASLSVLSVTALATNGPLVIENAENKKCLAFPLETPATEPEAALTLKSCLTSSEAGGVFVLLPKEEKAYSIEAMVSEAGSELAVVRFQNGTFKDAVARKDLAPETREFGIAGSPVWDAEGALIALTRSCQANKKKQVSCDTVSLLEAKQSLFLADVKQAIWGDEVPVAGDSHQFWGHFFRRRHRGGGFHGGYYGGGGSVSINIQIVQVVQVVHVHNHVTYNINNSNVVAGSNLVNSSVNQNTNQSNTNDSHNSNDSHNRYVSARAQDHDDEPAYRTVAYEPPPPPPIPSYIGIYDPNGVSNVALRHDAHESIAKTGADLRKDRLAAESQIQLASSQPVDRSRSAEYLASLDRGVQSTDTGRYVARREAPKASGVLVADNKK